MMVPLIEQRRPIEVIGSGSKRSIGRPVEPSNQLSTASMRGIWFYEPNELVMSAQAGTPVAQIEAELSSQGQMLAFEPIDLGPATGGARGIHTIGGCFATNLSGSRRISAGAARDHLLGIEGVNGRAEVFRSGGRVMKNVTGYDLCRGLCGSWGTLAVLTETTFKVLPAPEEVATLVYVGLPDDIAIELLCSSLRLPYEVSGTVHLDETAASRLGTEALSQYGQSITALRIENFEKSVIYRKRVLREQLKVYGEPIELNMETSLSFWQELRHLSVMPYRADTCLWRVSTIPSHGPKVVAAIKRHMPAVAYYDWSGGLIWIEVQASADAGTSDVRRAVAVHGGHATLIRADAKVRASVEVFQPQAPVAEKIMRGLKSVFDPYGMLNQGRMYASI